MMKEISKILIIIYCFLFVFEAKAESKILSIGSADAKITVKVFSSLTCPHCANFHAAIFNNLKRDYIDKGLVKFEHHAFPLDLAALNAEIIVRCTSDNNKKFKLLEEIYNKQKLWAVGSDISKINELIKKVGLDFNLTTEKMDRCLKDSVLKMKYLIRESRHKKNIKLNQLLPLLLMKKYEKKD